MNKRVPLQRVSSPDQSTLRSLFGVGLRRNQIFWLPLFDRLVGAELQMHYLEAGMVSPIVAKIMGAFGGGSNSISFEDIVDYTGARGRHGSRVLGEVLSILIRAKCIEEVRAGRFAGLAVAELQVEQSVPAVVNTLAYYHPHSGEISYMEPTRSAKRSDCNIFARSLPGEQRLYEESGLKERIAEVANNRWRSRRMGETPIASLRAEIFQGSGLMSGRDVPLKTVVTRVQRTKYWVWHRCCFSIACQVDGPLVQLFVLRGWVPARSEGYTTYLRDRCSDPIFFRALRQNAVRVDG